ncbi:MAG TPA: hypothetical protein VOA64_08090 [Candidatus Dormibacteraeota bacterium]|nr:hypothetical protein [Candidatus Dormibacteraeota bacterium]
MPIQWVTVFLGIWAAVGPLVGIYIGHHLLRSQQRRQWLADNRMQEWREIITTLQKSLVLITQFDAARNLSTIEEKKAAMPAVLDARAAALSVLNNRLFVAKEVRHHKMFDKWKRAVDEFDGHHDAGKFGTLFGELTALIEVEARAEIDKL